MKTYPYQDGDRLIQLVEKRELDQLVERLDKAEELLREIRDDEVNPQDEADKFLRDHQPSELAKMRADNAELLDRLSEARESHLHASARDVQTIQKQSVMLERFAKTLGKCKTKDWFMSDDTGEVIVALDAGEMRSALSAHESANLEPCKTCGGSKMTSGWSPTYQDPDNAGMHPEAEPCPDCQPVANPVDEAVRRMEAVPVLELNKLHFDAMDYGNFNDIEAVRARLIQAAKGEQL